MKNLEDIRKVIDDCDKKLVEAFEQRLRAVLDVLECKKEYKMPIFQPEREEDVFNKVNSYLKHHEFANELKLLYSQILKTSKQLQSRHMFPFNIVLIGFMGSGKTSVAIELSNLLEMKYVDTDEIIIENSGIAINDIFNAYGETGFRSLERKAVESLQGIKNTIISCGGGIVLNPENIDLLKDNGKVVWLNVSPQETYKRLLGDNSRPLLQNNLSLERLSDILKNRLPLYEAASDIIVDTDDKDVPEVAREIIDRLLSTG